VEHNPAILSKDLSQLLPRNLPFFFKHPVRNPDINNWVVKPTNAKGSRLLRQFRNGKQLELEFLDKCY
jgi:hypothetical protein